MNLIDITIRLDAIRDFLMRVSASVDTEYSDIWRREEAGEFAGIDDLPNALFPAMMSEEIAVRATLSELNALVESKLQALAVKPFFETQAKKKPNPSKQTKLVWDCRRTELQSLVETFHGLKIADMPCADAVDEVHRTINAWKHRQGVKIPQKDYPGSNSAELPQYIEKFKLDRQLAFASIAAVREFLKGLHLATREKRSSSYDGEESDFAFSKGGDSTSVRL